MVNKKARGAKQLQKDLTAVELEMMNVIWRIGPCLGGAGARAPAAAARAGVTRASPRWCAILEQKGYVTSEKEGRGHVYAAAVSKESYQALSLKRIVRNVFDGAPSLLVQRLLASEALAPEELRT
ncbi:MAG: BlaI/MecI/CopY family transcriptional regulator [Hyphomicrobium sp.]|uniref:BlaI/MecI/CopY family transcriptional regulator n=1 Tax=Hyphomicrobium sp. TaxID=82 RepID=UPI0039E5D79E